MTKATCSFYVAQEITVIRERFYKRISFSLRGYETFKDKEEDTILPTFVPSYYFFVEIFLYVISYILKFKN